MTQFQSPFADMFFKPSGAQPAPTAVLVEAFARTGRRAAARTGRTGRDSSRRTPARRMTQGGKTLRRAA